MLTDGLRTAGFNTPNGHSRGYNDQPGPYNGRGSQSRPDSYVDSYFQPSDGSYNQNQGWGPRRQPQSSKNPYYMQHAPQKSYDTTTASASNTESWGNYSTDPSSVSSSLEQAAPMHVQGTAPDKYGFGAAPGSGFEMRPSVPPHGARIALNAPSAPSATGAGGVAASNRGQLRKNTSSAKAAPPEKKKGWFKRRFSKQKD